MLSHRLAAVASLALLSAACRSDIIVDEWGPPAGYAAVEGTVTRESTGAPLAGHRVTIGRCDPDLVGHFPSATTDARGRYRTEGSLPPVGLMGRFSVDTLRVRCEAFVGAGSAPLDSLTVRFFRTRPEVVPHTLDLRVP